MISCWIASSFERVYRNSYPKPNRYCRLDLGQGDRGSFQACIRNGTLTSRTVDVECSSDVLDVKVRRVGYVPVPHLNTETPLDQLDGLGQIPGFVPDPLFWDLTGSLEPEETRSFWVTVKTPRDCSPGVYSLVFRFRLDDGEEYTVEACVVVHPVTLEKRKDFPVTHWFYTDALCDWYGVNPFDEGFWRIVKPYIEDLVEHGTNVLHTPLFTPPTDGVKRPTQLLAIRRDGDRYEFDWSQVKRWVDLARTCGVEYFEWPHLFSQWGVTNAIRIYENYDGQYEDRLLWPPETGADSEVYRNFLSQFLPAFKAFLDAEGLVDSSFFHLSDEPHGEEHLANYRKARAILKELAPWMKVMDAVSEVAFAESGLTDMPVASILTSLEFYHRGIPRWDYFCCVPRGNFLNRLVDTPLAKIRGAGWLFYRFESRGFLHWGYNYWYKRATTQLIDPYTVLSAHAWPNWPYGDTFVVYPGSDGPISSLRWEVFGESLNDYALLQTLGIPVDSPQLRGFKGYDDYPKDGQWYQQTRAVLLATASK
ncbi:MAG TPA: DUF4091 domain-containing protein [Firmicutes bacterium]|nr:DUF4091 domain-containing protein [Bacillota bacterium]